MKRYNIVEVLEAPVGTKFISALSPWVWEVKKRKGYNILVNEKGGEMELNSFYTNLVYEKAPLKFNEVMRNLKSNTKVMVSHKLINKTNLSEILPIISSNFVDEEIADILLIGKWYTEEE